MEKKKPIKRHPAIVEFSRDHHFALLLVWKIKEGLKKSIEISRISKYVVHFYDTNLIHHFKEEETMLFNKITITDPLVLKTESEHVDMRNLIEVLRNNSDDKKSLESFSALLEKHVRFEERELFNYLQEHIPEKVLAEVEASIESRTYRTDGDWEDTFWEREK